MNFSEWLVSSAGTGILLASIGCLSKNWIITRLKGSIDHEYNVKLEKHKANLEAATQKQLLELRSSVDVEFEKFRVRIGPYTEKQFERYNELWIALTELRHVMDDLWHSADADTLDKFSGKLGKLYRNLEKSALLIEENHYQKLMASLDVFVNYKIGKQTLIDLREHTDNNYIYNVSEKISLLISENEKHRINLNQAMKDLMDEMRNQLNGTKMLR